MLANAERILQLVPTDTLPSRERVDRILMDRAIAKARLTGCSTAPPSALASRWAGADASSTRTDLLRDSDKQQATLQLIYDTEIETDKRCGAPTGDDALLLLLAQSSVLEEVSHR